jgi:hypothetical protein
MTSRSVAISASFEASDSLLDLTSLDCLGAEDDPRSPASTPP